MPPQVPLPPPRQAHSYDASFCAERRCPYFDHEQQICPLLASGTRSAVGCLFRDGACREVARERVHFWTQRLCAEAIREDVEQATLARLLDPPTDQASGVARHNLSHTLHAGLWGTEWLRYQVLSCRNRHQAQATREQAMPQDKDGNEVEFPSPSPFGDLDLNAAQGLLDDLAAIDPQDSDALQEVFPPQSSNATQSRLRSRATWRALNLLLGLLEDIPDVRDPERRAAGTDAREALRARWFAPRPRLPQGGLGAPHATSATDGFKRLKQGAAHRNLTQEGYNNLHARGGYADLALLARHPSASGYANSTRQGANQPWLWTWCTQLLGLNWDELQRWLSRANRNPNPPAPLGPPPSQAQPQEPMMKNQPRPLAPSQTLLEQARAADPWRDTHPPTQVLVGYAYEKTDPQTTHQVRAHLMHCADPSCRDIIALCREDHLAHLAQEAPQEAHEPQEANPWEQAWAWLTKQAQDLAQGASSLLLVPSAALKSRGAHDSAHLPLPNLSNSNEPTHPPVSPPRLALSGPSDAPLVKIPFKGHPTALYLGAVQDGEPSLVLYAKPYQAPTTIHWPVEPSSAPGPHTLRLFFFAQDPRRALPEAEQDGNYLYAPSTPDNLEALGCVAVFEVPYDVPA